jgi:hypothetical protein
MHMNTYVRETGRDILVMDLVTLQGHGMGVKVELAHYTEFMRPSAKIIPFKRATLP